jgi:hypothetical protein
MAMKLSSAAIERVTSAFAPVDLGDPRRAERLVHTVRKLAQSPDASIPKAMGSEADLEGAYRLLRNPRVTLEKLIEAQAQTTSQRAKKAGRVLAIHDTTQCEFARADAEAVGYLNTGKAGFMAHYSLVVDGDGSRRPLGVAYAEAISRTKPPSKPGKTKKRTGGTESHQKDDRESLRWFRGFSSVAERLEGCQVVHVADREGDNYELFASALEHDLHFVIRVRVGARRARLADGTRGTVTELAQSSAGVLKREVSLSPRKGRQFPGAGNAHPPRDAREATLTFAATVVEIPRPQYCAKAVPRTLRLNLVTVREENPPAGEAGVEWILFTTEPVDRPEQVAAIIDIYRTRWLIEECNKALKSVCKYEERHLETRDALLTLLAMTFPIACELLWLRAAARATPNRPASEVLTRTQLQILRIMGSYELSKTPTVHEAVWAVAALGGHIRSNGEPGILVLYRGMADLLAYERAWLAREEVGGLAEH